MKVKISAPTLNPSDVEVTTANGVPICGIREVHFVAYPQALEENVVTLVLEVMPFQAWAMLEIWLQDPNTGQRKKVKRIEWADGSDFVPRQDAPDRYKEGAE